jgi:hypothetical protein
MAMTLHAGKRGTHESFPCSIHTIHYCCGAKFFIICTPLVVCHGIPIEGSGNEISIGWVGKQVAGDLLA